MPKAVMVVYSRPTDPARDDDYNDWYDNVHLREVCEVPGFVSARRYEPDDFPKRLPVIQPDRAPGNSLELEGKCVRARVDGSLCVNLIVDQLQPSEQATAVIALGPFEPRGDKSVLNRHQCWMRYWSISVPRDHFHVAPR